MKIWKYALEITDEQVISVPMGARALSVQKQGRDPMLWCLVNPANGVMSMKIQIVGTGNECPSNLGEFIGTVQDPPFVWHVFWNPKEKS